MKANSRRPISLHQPATHQEFGPGSGRRCVICWQPSWARGPGLWLPSLCAASVQPGHWGWARPAEAVSASRSRTRTAPWHVNGDEKRPSSNLAGLLSSACYRSHQPGTSPYSALPNKKNNPRLLTVRPWDCRTRSFLEKLKARRTVVLKLSAASVHWLLQNPTVLTVALADWSLHGRGAGLPGASLTRVRRLSFWHEIPNPPPGALVGAGIGARGRVLHS